MLSVIYPYFLDNFQISNCLFATPAKWTFIIAFGNLFFGVFDNFFFTLGEKPNADSFADNLITFFLFKSTDLPGL